MQFQKRVFQIRYAFFLMNLCIIPRKVNKLLIPQKMTLAVMLKYIQIDIFDFSAAGPKIGNIVCIRQFPQSLKNNVFFLHLFQNGTHSTIQYIPVKVCDQTIEVLLLLSRFLKHLWNLLHWQPKVLIHPGLTVLVLYLEKK